MRGGGWEWGSSKFYFEENVKTHPGKFVVSYLGNTYSLWIYIWTITHGGRVSLRDEYRIQMTSVSSPLPKNPSGLTVLMRYYQDLKMFAGFDLRKHSTFTGKSPSVQIGISAIHSDYFKVRMENVELDMTTNAEKEIINI